MELKERQNSLGWFILFINKLKQIETASIKNKLFNTIISHLVGNLFKPLVKYLSQIPT